VYKAVTKICYERVTEICALICMSTSSRQRLQLVHTRQFAFGWMDGLAQCECWNDVKLRLT